MESSAAARGSRRLAFISVAPADGKADELEDADERVRGLVSAARGGDREAFGALYRLFHGAVFRLARFHVPGDAEDIAAETFVRAWAALPRYRDTGAPFVAWLYGIARHLVADEFSRRSRTDVRSDVPEVAMEDANEDRVAIAAAVERLPVEQRQVIELKFLVGLRNPQVAEALGRTAGAVNALQWRALRALRARMEER
jgi:RNA polymerase sigma-70 factor, ECF subfamily